MDRRRKILTALFGAVLVYVLLANLVYPQWIEPMLNFDERIADRQKEYERLAELKDAVDQAAKRYEALVARAGSFDIGKVETAIRARLNALIEEHRLQGANVSPSRPNKDRKTGLTTMLITVTATGRLGGAIEFLKDLAELPQLVRVGNAAIYPASASRGGSRDRMNLRVPIEVMVLPQQRRIVGRIDEEELVQPESYVRHAGLDYSLIWSTKPFTEPIPLRANAGRDVSRRQGQSARLKATATGGDGEYTAWEWDPTDGLDNPTSPEATVDTSEAFTRTYTVKVTDGSGETATDSVAVTIRESSRRKPKPPEPVAKQERSPVDQRWPNRKQMQLCMTLLRSSEAGEFGELMIANEKLKQTEYYAVGDTFDGGELVFVHPRGGVVHRNDEYFIYPIGGRLDQDLSAGDAVAATEYPDLKAAAQRLLEEAKAQAEAQPEAADGPPVGPETDAAAEPASDEIQGKTEPSPAKATKGPKRAPRAAPNVRKKGADQAASGDDAQVQGSKSKAERGVRKVRKAPTKGKGPHKLKKPPRKRP